MFVEVTQPKLCIFRVCHLQWRCPDIYFWSGQKLISFVVKDGKSGPVASRSWEQRAVSRARSSAGVFDEDGLFVVGVEMSC